MDENTDWGWVGKILWVIALPIRFVIRTTNWIHGRGWVDS